jgi:uncharacterized protein
VFAKQQDLQYHERDTDQGNDPAEQTNRGTEMRTVEMDEQRLAQLHAYDLQLLSGVDRAEAFRTYERAIRQARPAEVMAAVDLLIEVQPDLQLVKPTVCKMMNAYGASLQQHQVYPEYDYPKEARDENSRIRVLIDRLTPVLKQIHHSGPDSGSVSTLIAGIGSLKTAVETRYVDLEHTLFPFIEQEIPHARCTALMWSIHDDVRSTITAVLQLLDRDDPVAAGDLYRLLGSLFFDVKGLIFREEYVLFPVLQQVCRQEDWQRLFDHRHRKLELSGISDRAAEASLTLPTGTLSGHQLVQIFSNLPVDITLVDAQDRVVFFNTPKHRIFPRNTAVIGQQVENCHPPKSIAVVRRILDSFRRRERTSAEFSLQVGDAYVLITYIALYTEDGSYDGVLEVLQDITEIRTKAGEHRLLDWD